MTATTPTRHSRSGENPGAARMDNSQKHDRCGRTRLDEPRRQRLLLLRVPMQLATLDRHLSSYLIA